MENICLEAFKIRKALNAYEAFKFGADCLRASQGGIEAAGLEIRSFKSFKSFNKYILLKPLKLIKPQVRGRLFNGFFGGPLCNRLQI